MIGDTILTAVALVLATAALLLAVLWKPLTKRVIPYLRIWWNRDQIAEAEARKESVARKAAEEEVKKWGVEGELENPERNTESPERNLPYPTRVLEESEEEKTVEIRENRQ
jgi:hypothetical protein